MEILFLLIPLGFVLLAAAVWAFVWAVRSGQFEDLEGPAWRVILDDDDPHVPRRRGADRPARGEGPDPESADEKEG
ncbi:MAG TPA: cbb3-type cytochrome oxidase assembly protein CcoS [Chromatiales bacterium]|nr:cbb3-type cytochrome oxidase assembly protein CcoS [Chromatiales bacterium]